MEEGEGPIHREKQVEKTKERGSELKLRLTLRGRK